MKEEIKNMKNIWNKIKKSILFYTIVVAVVFVITHFLLKIFNAQFRQWVYYSILVLVLIGIITGIIQIVRKKNKKIKIIFLTIGLITSILIIIFWKVILLIIVFSYSPEHVVIKDDKKYLAYVNSFLKVDVYYYDYINFFLIGNKLRLHEYYGSGGYDPLDGTHNNKPLQYYYYDEQGNITDTNDEYYNKGYSNSKVYDKEGNEIANLPDTNNSISTNNNLEEISKYEEVLYEKKINDKTIIRVVNNGYILAQRLIVSVQKTIDGGNTWTEQIEDSDGFIQIHNNSQFVFIDENIGFINDPGLAGTSGENRGLLVTTNGGKTFIDSNIVNENNIDGDIFFEGVPYLDNKTLKVKGYLIKNSQKTEIILYSTDNGLTWKI